MLRNKIATIWWILWSALFALLYFNHVSFADAPYQTGERSRHGIGKYYMGREISQVMGHRGARWLERHERSQEEATDLLLDLLPLESTMIVADIGAGTGYFALPIAKRVPDGKVLAVDIQPQMLELIRSNAETLNITNLNLIQGRIDNPLLPAGEVDIALLVDAYHEFEYPHEMAVGIWEGLKPGGRVVLVEYRAEDPDVPILKLHKMSAEQAIKEWQAAGYIFEQNISVLPQQHVLIFRKPVPEL